MRAQLRAAGLCLIILTASIGIESPPEAFSSTQTAGILPLHVLQPETEPAGEAFSSTQTAGIRLLHVLQSETEPAGKAVPTSEIRAESNSETEPKSEPRSEPVVEHVPLPPVHKPVIVRTRHEICETLARVAHKNDLPIPYFIRLLFQESRFKPGAVSAAGAQGIAQFMPETSADVGLDNPFDPLQAIPASARLLRQLSEKFGNLGLAAAAYNAGPKRVLDWLAKKADMPAETKGYVKAITGRPAEAWRARNSRGTAHSLPSRAPCRETVPVMPLPRPSRLILAALQREKSAKPAKVAKHAKSAKSGKVTKVAKHAKSAKSGKITKVAKHVKSAKSGKVTKVAKEDRRPKASAHSSRHRARTEQLAARQHTHANRAEN